MMFSGTNDTAVACLSLGSIRLTSMLYVGGVYVSLQFVQH